MPFIAAALVLAAPALSSPAAPTIKLVRKIVGLHPFAMAAGPSGAMIAMTTEKNDVRIFNAANQQTLKTFTGHPQPPYAVAWSPDGTFIASGDESARIFLWNVKSGAKVETIIGHIRGIQKLSFNSSRTLLASTGKDDVINVWKIPSGKKAAQILGKGANVYGAEFSPRVNTLVTGVLAGGARLYRITTGAHIQAFLTSPPIYGQTHGALDSSWNPAGTKVVTAGNDGNAMVWDAKKYKKLGTLKGHQDMVIHAIFSPDGAYIATSSPDRTVRLWNVVTMRQVGILNDQSAIGAPICFSPDGRFLLTTGVDDSLEVYALHPALSPRR